MRSGYDGICNNPLVANSLRSISLKEFCNQVGIWCS